VSIGKRPDEFRRRKEPDTSRSGKPSQLLLSVLGLTLARKSGRPLSECFVNLPLYFQCVLLLCLFGVSLKLFAAIQYVGLVLQELVGAKLGSTIISSLSFSNVHVIVRTATDPAVRTLAECYQ
jgi:hypothetical protein